MSSRHDTDAPSDNIFEHHHFVHHEVGREFALPLMEKLESVGQSLHDLHRKVDLLMTTEAELQALAEGIANSVQAAQVAAESAVKEIGTLETTLAGIQVGSVVSQEQADAIAASLSGSKAALDSTSAALASGVAAAQAAPAPSGGEPAAGEEPEAPAAPSVPSKPVYLYLGSDPASIDASQWSASGFETVPAEGVAAPLYYFSGDTGDGSGPNGNVAGEWEAFTGATQPVPAA